jgi:hypothetical protein
MSFQVYIDNIKKNGQNTEDFEKIAKTKSILNPGVTAGDIVVWLKQTLI